MSHRASKRIRQILKNAGVDPTQREYKNKSVQAITKFGTNTIQTTMDATSLSPACGRYTYQQAKSALV